MEHSAESPFEQRVVHAMAGSILVSPQALRLHAIEARLDEEVTVGFGPLARLNSDGQISDDQRGTENR
jgi:hypothetical protein